MADLKRWKIVEAFTIYQIALLLEGYDPADFEELEFSNWDSQVRRQISPILTALHHAVDDRSLPLHSVVDQYEDGPMSFEASLVHVGQLRKWLTARGISREFFGSVVSPKDDDEAPVGRFYAQKLAAANAAWKAVTSDPKRLLGKSPKRALVLWLTEHAAEYDLLNKDGTPNATGIEEVAKVANWNPAGGAPNTAKAGTKSGEAYNDD